MAEVEKVAGLFTLLLSLWPQVFVVCYSMTWTGQHMCYYYGQYKSRSLSSGQIMDLALGSKVT